MYPFHNDADENYEEKLRLHKDLNDVRIGHWKSHDGKEEYYSPVSIYVIEDMYAHGLKYFTRKLGYSVIIQNSFL